MLITRIMRAKAKDSSNYMSKYTERHNDNIEDCAENARETP